MDQRNGVNSVAHLIFVNLFHYQIANMLDNSFTFVPKIRRESPLALLAREGMQLSMTIPISYIVGSVVPPGAVVPYI